MAKLPMILKDLFFFTHWVENFDNQPTEMFSSVDHI